jgi:hypothetical protein
VYSWDYFVLRINSNKIITVNKREADHQVKIESAENPKIAKTKTASSAPCLKAIKKYPKTASFLENFNLIKNPKRVRVEQRATNKLIKKRENVKLSALKGLM